MAKLSLELSGRHSEGVLRPSSPPTCFLQGLQVCEKVRLWTWSISVPNHGKQPAANKLLHLPWHWSRAMCLRDELGAFLGLNTPNQGVPSGLQLVQVDPPHPPGWTGCVWLLLIPQGHRGSGGHTGSGARCAVAGTVGGVGPERLRVSLAPLLPPSVVRLCCTH